MFRSVIRKGLTTLALSAAFVTAGFVFFASNASAFYQQTCESRTLPVHLIEGDPTTYNLVGQLCWRGSLHGKPLQLLVHGATLNKSYWDFPYGGSRYSYVDFANLLGFATFAYDRLGSGESDRPLGILVNLDNSAYVNHQVVEALRNGTFGEHFEKIVQVGHSFGSLITVASASAYPGDVDGVVLTGFAHQVTEQANSGTQANVYPAAFDPKFAGQGYDDFYFTTIPGSRTQLFFNPLLTDPNVLTADEQEKDILTLGLVLDIPRHLSTESLAIDVPVYEIMGTNDFFYCGEAIDCAHNDNAGYKAYEEAFFDTDLETKLVPLSGHNLNLHKNNLQTFALIHSWILRKIY